MSATSAQPATSTRTVLPPSDAVWDTIRVDACRALLAEWSQAKVNSKMKKTTAVGQLVETSVSVDFSRVFRWRDQGVVDPGAQPQDGAEPREWALDRTFFLLMEDGKISEKRLVDVEELGLKPHPGQPQDVQVSTSGSLSVDGLGGPHGHSNVPGGGSAAPGALPSESSAKVSASGDPLSREGALAGTEAGSASGRVASSAGPCVTGTALAKPSAADDGVATTVSVNEAISTSATVASSPAEVPDAAGPAAPGGVPDHAQVMDRAAAPGAGLLVPGVMPTTGSPNDPYWPILGRALREYAFKTVHNNAPVLGPHGVPLNANGVITASGRIALFGKDRRSQNDSQPVDLLLVLDDVRLSYLSGTGTVTASSNSIMQALSQQPMLRGGHMYVLVSIGVNTTEYCIGHIMDHGGLAMSPNVEVPLFTLAPSCSTVVYQRIRFGTALQVFGIWPTRLGPLPALPPAQPPALPPAQPPAQAARSRHGGTKSTGRAKKAKEGDVVNLALAQWLRVVDGGVYMDDESVVLLRSTKDSLFPFSQVIKQIDVVKDMFDRGYADAKAPPAARGKKVTHIAIAYIVRRSVGWVRNALTVDRLLYMYGDEKKVKALVKSLKHRAVGVKTILEGLKEAIDESSTAGDVEEPQQAYITDDGGADDDDVVDPDAQGEDYSADDEYVEVNA